MMGIFSDILGVYIKNYSINIVLSTKTVQTINVLPRKLSK